NLELFTLQDALPAFVDENPAGANVKVTPLAMLNPGLVRRSFVYMRHFADQSGIGSLPYHLYVGCEVNTLALSAAPEAFATLNFGIAGKSPVLMAAPPAGSV